MGGRRMNLVAASAVESKTFLKDCGLEAIAAGSEACSRSRTIPLNKGRGLIALGTVVELRKLRENGRSIF
jgi:hypothetical protein